jgi:hypothetical protein
MCGKFDVAKVFLSTLTFDLPQNGSPAFKTNGVVPVPDKNARRGPSKSSAQFRREAGAFWRGNVAALAANRKALARGQADGLRPGHVEEDSPKSGSTKAQRTEKPERVIGLCVPKEPGENKPQDYPKPENKVDHWSTLPAQVILSL